MKVIIEDQAGTWVAKDEYGFASETGPTLIDAVTAWAKVYEIVRAELGAKTVGQASKLELEKWTSTL